VHSIQSIREDAIGIGNLLETKNPALFRLFLVSEFGIKGQKIKFLKKRKKKHT